MPRVTVVASFRDEAAAAEASVRSVLGQSFGELRCIVYDDASTDGTSERLAAIAAEDRRLELFVNRERRGLTANLVDGLALAKGEFIARIDAGDLWLPEKLARQVAFMEENPAHVLCGTQVFYRFAGRPEEHVSAFGRTDGELRQRISRRAGLFEHSSVLFRPVCGYRKAFAYAQDCDLYLRLAERGLLHCLSEPLCVCRVKTEGITLGHGHLQRRYRRAAYSLAAERAHGGIDRLERSPDGQLGIVAASGGVRQAPAGAPGFRQLCGGAHRTPPVGALGGLADAGGRGVAEPVAGVSGQGSGDHAHQVRPSTCPTARRAVCGTGPVTHDVGEIRLVGASVSTGNGLDGQRGAGLRTGSPVS